MTQHLKVQKLIDVPHLANECGRWLFEEWGHRKNSTLNEVQERFRYRLTKDGPPIAFVATDGIQAAGTISLIEKEDELDEVGPWIASLFVLETFRGQGIARKLLRAAEDHAVRLQVGSVWLSAATPEMYAAEGYEFTGLTKNGEPVMTKALR
ncbi:GNAT family N-acetyltransferase [Leisingera caerulea]|uniref:GNAT family N-acetyltransferase n=1 Tax=Leisingera caerulea TaxID=506591 RepID=A0A9Q9LYG7_LEICA|nr:GNAT family N-acetyltransferase [Leisingera caerulea]UWQ56000.1 GNAT family N-acetyltransferase [Leisingera caerulea]